MTINMFKSLKGLIAFQPLLELFNYTGRHYHHARLYVYFIYAWWLRTERPRGAGTALAHAQKIGRSISWANFQRIFKVGKNTKSLSL